MIVRLMIPIPLILFLGLHSWLGSQCSPRFFLHQASRSQNERSTCRQAAGEQAAILRRAQNEKYSLRRIEFIGNANTDDWTLRRRLLLQEGNIFARATLIKGLESVNRLRTIYPVRLSDVITHLNVQEKTIDVTICFREKKPSRPVSRH
jgi:outer membrane protein assembly factor BamA